MSKGFFGGLFGFDNDGKLDAFEQAVDTMMLMDLMKDEQLNNSELDFDELEYMSDYERREALENADIDTDDFDF